MNFVKLCMLFMALASPFSLPALADWGPGHGPGWGHGPGYGPGWGPRPVACYAQNWRGDTFRGVSYDYRRAQYEAMNTCAYYSHNPRSCRLIGCE